MWRWSVVALGVLGLLAARGAGRFLVVNDDLPPRADAIVVLAGSIADRVLEAADLYRAGVAPRVLVTRERLPAGLAELHALGVSPPESDQITREALVRLGVPPGAIATLRRRTTSTATEARTIARHACAHGLRSLVVVTSRTHTRRARLILRRALGSEVALTIRGSRYDPFPASRWWRRRHAAKQLLGEYEKLAHHWLRERWEIRPCGGLRRRSGGRG